MLLLRLARGSPRCTAHLLSPNLPSPVSSSRALSSVVHAKNTSRSHRNNLRLDSSKQFDSKSKLRPSRPPLSRRQTLQDDSGRHKKTGPRPRKAPKQAPPRKLVLPDIGLSSHQLAALADVPSDTVFSCVRELDDTISYPTSILSPALIELATEELSLNLQFVPQTQALLSPEHDSDSTQPRMPVVTVMGHVDHGKTSLLDALRMSDVAKHEAGAITQSVAAFQVPIKASGAAARSKSSFITFIDTPGHAAFKRMRANGTVATDLVILVVAADDGVMPQTVECAQLAKAANVPVIVAINKCDAPGADPEKVRYQLLDKFGMNTEQLGGEVQCVDISAKTGRNLPELLEAVSLQAEMLGLQSDLASRATGICLESRVDHGMGSIATVVVRSGTLRPGDHVVFQSPLALRGDLFGRVRGLIDSNGEAVKEAAPGVAVGIAGVREPIPPGAEFCVELNERAAKARSKQIITKNLEAVETIELANSLCRQREAAGEDGDETDSGQEGSADRERNELSSSDGNERIRSVILLIKGDVKGSADAVAQYVQPLGTDQYPIRIIDAGVGDVTDSDIARVAAIRQAKGNRDELFIIAFNLRVKEPTTRMARQAGVTILSHNVIYHLEDDLKERLGKIHDELKRVEVAVGKAAVVRVFEDGKIAGCSVNEGEVSIGDTANVLRYADAETGNMQREVVYSGTVNSIKQFAKSVRSVKRGVECGIGLDGWTSFLAGDQIQCVVSKKASDVS